MDKKTFEKIMGIFNKMYPNVTVSLNFNSAFELVICLILAAQCTDKRVNMIRPILFEKYPDVYSLAKADKKELETIIHSCGFYRNKAKNIQKASKQIIENFNGIVPNTMEDLQTLAGIGRKSANCILADVFHDPQGVAIDTHAKRICNRLGISKSDNPLKIEQDLLNVADKKHWQNLNLILVSHGREFCKAKNPLCYKCELQTLCKYYINNKN